MEMIIIPWRFVIKRLALSFALITTILIFSGCSNEWLRGTVFYEAIDLPRIVVTVNGYKGESIKPLEGRKVYVYKNNQAPHILLENEVVKKLKAILKIKGYVPVDRPEDSDYFLFAFYGISSGSPEIYSTSSNRHELNVFTGQFEMVPNVNISTATLYQRHLKLTLYETRTFLLSQNLEPIWIGEMKSTGNKSDLRYVIDYLIVAGFEHFGEDTKEQKKKTMLPADERVKRLREEFPFVESSDYYQIPSVDVSGNWSGLWRGGNGMSEGGLSMSLTQDGSILSGTVIIKGSPCFSAGNITGMVIKNNMTSTIFSGNLRIDFNGTMVENKMNGSYAVINGGACTGDSGTWMVSK